MQYMLLILEKGEERRSRPVEEGRVLYDSMMRYAKGLKERGVFVAGEALASDTRGARVTAQAGKHKVVDGPFAEAKEMVGGFFIVDCASREEAIALAKECPAAQWAVVEVRDLAPCYE